MPTVDMKHNISCSSNHPSKVSKVDILTEKSIEAKKCLVVLKG